MEYFCPKCDRRFDADGQDCPDCKQSLLPVQTADDLIGRDVDGRFEVQKLLGEGGMGSVYIARQKSVDRLVALKVLHQELLRDATAVKRFLLEAKASSCLVNPHTITIYDFGKTADGLLYIAMEYLRGRTLREKIAVQGRLGLNDVVDFLDQVGESLAEAHDRGIVHRDLKPENVFLTRTDDGREFVKVLDFGIARAQSLSGVSHVTTTGTIVGTPAYMSPEIIVGERADERADVYALGIIMYELLTGHVPFDAETPMHVMMQHLNAEPQPVELVAPDVSVPRSLHRFLWRCLAKNKELRPRNAREFRVGLKEAMGAASGSGSEPMAPVYTTAEGFRLGPEALEMITTKKQAASPKPDAGGRTPRPGQPAESRGDAYSDSGSEPVLAGGVVAREGQLMEAAAGLGRVSGRRHWLLGAAAVLVAVALAAVLVVTRTPAALDQERTTAAPPSGLAPNGKDAAPGEAVPAVSASQGTVQAPVAIGITSEPAGATVTIDGKVEGRTPYHATLPRGSRPLVVVLGAPGFRDEILALVPDRDQQLSRTLTPVPAVPAPEVVLEAGTGAGGASTSAPKPARKAVSPARVKPTSQPPKSAVDRLMP